MKRFSLPLAASLLALVQTPVHGADPVPVPTPVEIVAAAPAADWAAIAPSDLLVMDLAPDGAGKSRRVVIQLLPVPFSQGWIGNIRKLAAAHWWDGTSVNRVQDNYVVQWGDADGDDKAKAKPLPLGLKVVPQGDYQAEAPKAWAAPPILRQQRSWIRDNYAGNAVFHGAWPLGTIEPGEPLIYKDAQTGRVIPPPSTQPFWPVHCYATVGVGRDMPPDTGSGAELYAVIGHAPRQLDRNIAVVGRVIEGIELLSSLPRGTGTLGFYEQAGERVPIVSVRIGDQVPGLPRYEYLSTESASFARYADARANRRDAFYIRPAGGADICNIPVPVRRAK